MGDIYYAVAHRDQAEIDSFKTRYADFPTQRIPEIFKISLGMTVTHWEPCRSFGTAHVIYYVSIAQEPTEFILRANLGFGSPEVVMLVEKLVTDHVVALGIPVNVVRFADVTRKKYPFDFQIEERLPGVDLEGNFSGTKDEYDRLSRELGTYVARYHDFPLTGLGDLVKPQHLRETFVALKNICTTIW